MQLACDCVIMLENMFLPVKKKFFLKRTKNGTKQLDI